METILLVILCVLAVVILLKLIDIRNTLTRLPSIEDRLKTIERQSRSKPAEKDAAAALATSPVPVAAPLPLTPPPVPCETARQTTAPAATPLPRPVQPPSPATPPAAPAPTPAWVENATGILKRIWQWILVGEEFRPRGVAMEYAIATTWLVRVGIVALVGCVAYFLKWSIQRELIGPAARVTISIFFGLGILGGGRRLLGKRYHILGQAFVGGGLATLYFSMYALGPLYHLLDSRAMVFGLMVLVTLSAGILALEAQSMLIAIFGIIGGFCTPILLRTGTPNFPALYSYLLVLNLGIFAISLLRPWRLLNYLGFLFTYGIFLGSQAQYRREDFPVVMTFLSLFFVVQSTLVFIHNLRRRLPCTVLEIIHLVLNAGVFSLAGYYLIRDAFGRPFPALLTLTIGIYFVLHVALFLRARLTDRPLILSAISLAVFYVAMTMPLVMEQESLTIAWALQSYLFLRLGRCMDNRFLRHLGYALYILTAIRLSVFEFPRFDLPGVSTPANWTVYGKSLTTRLWTFGSAVASLFAAFRLERRYLMPAAQSTTASDIPETIPATMARHAFFWGITAALFLYLQFELNVLFALLPPWRMPALTALWCVAAVFFILLHRATRTIASLVAGLFFAAGAVLKTLLFDFSFWHLSHHGYFGSPYLWPAPCARILDFTFVISILVLGAVWFRAASSPRTVPAVFGYTTLALLWLYGTLEIATLLHWKLPAFQKGGVSVWWTAFAFSMLAGGIWKNIRPIRYAALLLFSIVILKIFFRDLAGMPIIFRVAALMALGVLLLLGAFAYLRAGKRFISTAAVLAVLGSTTALAAMPPDRFPSEKTLSPSAGHPADVGQWRIDDELFDAADAGFGNVRLYAPNGKETPFLIKNKAQSRAVENFVPVSVSSSVESLRQLETNRVELIVVRKATEPEVAGIQLESSIRNFEKRVTVSGSQDRSNWTPLVESAPIYDYSRFIDLRHDRISFPPSRFTVYRIEISNMTEQQDSPLVEIIRQTRGTAAPTETEATAFRREPFRIDQIRFLERRESIVSDSVEQTETGVQDFRMEHDTKARTTILSFSTHGQPVTAFLLVTEENNFSRTACVEAETEQAPRSWQRLTCGTLSRIRIGGLRQEQLTLPAPAVRYRKYRIIIQDMDNPPLDISAIRIRHNEMVGLFFPKVRQTHRLCYGGQDVPAPAYDVASVLAKVVPDTVQTWTADNGRPNPDYASSCAFRLCSGKTGMTLALLLMAGVLLILIARLARKVNLQQPP